MSAHITTQRAEHNIPIRVSCRALGVSESWYYKHRGRRPTPGQQRRGHLIDAVWKYFKDSGFTYGSPRVTRDLQDAGWRVSENTVAAIMAEYGWVGRERPPRRNLTRQGVNPAPADRVKRRFTAQRPDQVWCGDVTMIRTGQGPLYLATVIDVFSRRCLGYAMSAHHDQQLTIASLRMATATRGGTVAGCVWHTDRGGEYTGDNILSECVRLRLLQSMGRVASALDNSVAESFNSTLKTEFVHRRFFATRAQARQQIGAWIETFYNARRRHSWCGGISPITYERHYQQAQQDQQDQQRSAA